MVDDRAGGVDAVVAIGRELTDQVEETEKKQVEGKLSDLTTRWDALSRTVGERQQALNSALEVAKDFYMKERPFADWLEKAEKKVSWLQLSFGTSR